MGFKKGKYTKAEWLAARRANQLRLVFSKDNLNQVYNVYKKKRTYTIKDELISTNDMGKLNDFFSELEEERIGSYQEVKGDLIEMAQKGEFDVIGHGCNCFATMGAGIAVAVKKAFKNAYDADKISKLSDIERLGGFTYGEYIHNPLIPESINLLVFNLYSQYMPGPSLDIEALTLSLRKMAMFLKGEEMYGTDLKIGLPLIGCGIAGGDWNEVSGIIKHELREFDVTIVIFDKN